MKIATTPFSTQISAQTITIQADIIRTILAPTYAFAIYFPSTTLYPNPGTNISIHSTGATFAARQHKAHRQC